MKRRDVLLAGLATAALPLARPVLASLSLGSSTLTTVSDGNLVLPPSFIFEPMPADELAAVLAAYDMAGDTLEPECNLTLWRSGDRVVLFDAGSGPDFQPSAGKILDGLEAAGVAPEDITDVIFTHAHPDHIWGVLDDFDEPLFVDAVHHIGRAERDYWLDPATIDTIGAARLAFAAGAIRRIEAMGDRLKPFEDGAEVVPGVTALLTPGHTPGHMSFVVADGTDAALVIGDAIGNHHVALARPEWPSGSDQDQPMAAETRVALLDMITADDLTIVGFHLPSGGLGKIDPSGSVARFVPA